MSVRLRLAGVVLALVAPLVLLLEHTGEREVAPVAHALPTDLGAYRVAREAVLEPEIAAQVFARDYVLREYRAPGLPPIGVYVAIYGSVRELGAGAHDPRLCYPAQGWEVVESSPGAVELSDGAMLRFDEMVTRQGRAEETVLFWIQPATRWPRAPAVEQLFGVVDAVAGRDQYAFVRLSAPALGGATRGSLRAFAGELAPHVRRALESALDGDGNAL